MGFKFTYCPLLKLDETNKWGRKEEKRKKERNKEGKTNNEVAKKCKCPFVLMKNEVHRYADIRGDDARHGPQWLCVSAM